MRSLSALSESISFEFSAPLMAANMLAIDAIVSAVMSISISYEPAAVGLRDEKTTPPITNGRHSHLASEGDLLYITVFTSAEKTGSPALTI